MGGDFAPDSPLKGIKNALPDLPENVELSLIGDEEVIRGFFTEKELSDPRLRVVHASEVISMGDSPTRAIAQKPDSSISVGFKQLKSNSIDVFISAGNTGAVLVGALYSVKAIEGVIRPAISTFVPKINGSVGMLLDVGINPDCRPDVLLQFAILGSLYLKYVRGIENPTVGLLNIGSEPEKGNLVTQAAYPLFESSGRIRFLGNIEGYEIMTGGADVIACDGFIGNVLLKTIESFYQIFKKQNLVNDFVESFNYELHGGTPILGINKPVLIGHGVSSPRAFEAMIRQAIDLVESNLIEKIKQAFEP